VLLSLHMPPTSTAEMSRLTIALPAAMREAVKAYADDRDATEGWVVRRAVAALFDAEVEQDRRRQEAAEREPITPGKLDGETVGVVVRLTPREHAALKRLARRHGVTPGALARQRVLG